MFKTEDEDIAKIVNVGGYVAISNAVCDGEAEVVIVTGSGSTQKAYRYGVRATTVTIEKTVVPSTEATDKSNATIRIVTHVLNKPKPRPPKILFFGTGCTAHDLTASETLKALNAIKEVGPVDWYLFQNWTTENCDKGLVDKGSLAPGDADITKFNVSLAGSSHYSLKAFHHWFVKVLSDPVTTNYYDYVVIETDGSRIAGEYGSSKRAGGSLDATDEAYARQTAELLKPYYDDGKVIWIMDDGYDFDNYLGKYPSYATAKDIFRYGTGYDLYRPNNLTMKNSSGTKFFIEPLNDTQWNGLLTILDPKTYLSGADTTVKENVKIRIEGDKDGTVTTKAATVNENQLFYHHEDEIGGKLKEIIKPVAYETEMSDTVLNLKNLGGNDTLVIPNGLGSVRLYTWSWPGGQSPAEVDPTKWRADVDGWTEDPSKTGLVLDGFTISNQVHNITNDCWRKIEVGIQFKEDFLETAKARKALEPEWPGIEWNGEKKVYEVNPNEGEAVVVLYRGGGESRIKCMATAQATVLALEMKDEQKKFDIRRAESVSKTYDGARTNIVIEVNDPPDGMTIKYRNKGGSDAEWKDYTVPSGWPYISVADSTNVEFKIEAKNYKTYVGTNDVKITAAPIVPPTDNPKPGPGEPGPGPGPAPQTEPDGPWAAAYNIEKDYDGLGTNVIFTYGHLDVKPTFRFAYTESVPAADSSEWKAYADVFTNVTYAADKKTVEWKKVWVRVTAGDNYVATNLYAHVKINPRNLGGGGGGDDAIVADDKSIAYGKDLPKLTWRGGNGLVDGDGVKTVDLALTNGVVASTLPKGVYPDIISTNAVEKAIVITNSVGADVTGNYTGFFTPGTLTVVAGGMEIGPGPGPGETPVVHPPEPEPPMPPADPNEPGSWTNGARSVTKTYDGKSTNIVVYVKNPAGAKIRYSYDGVNFYDSAFPGYTAVTNLAPVWYEASDPDGNFRSITNRAFVTINAAPIVPPTDNPKPGPGEPGPGPGPAPQTEPDGPWAAAYNVEKDYDGLGTNVIFTYGYLDVKPTFRFAYTESVPAADSSEWKAYSDLFTNVTYAADKKTVEWKKVWVRVTAGDNYVATNIYAHVKINPKNLGGGGGGDDAIVADDQSIAYGGTLPTLTWRGGNGLVDGDGVKTVDLALTNDVDASTLPKGVYPGLISTNAAVAQAIVITNSAGTDVTGNYTGFFTPGTLTVVAGGMEIGPDGPVEHPPAGQPPIPPADPEDEKSWTNGALSVTKTYDGKATNIVVTVLKPASGSTITYSYDKTDWKPYGAFDGYTDVTNKATVWFRIEAPNYQTITNCAFVTINAAPIVPPPDKDNPPPGPGEPGPGSGPAPLTEPDGPWAAAYNVEKDYDGIGTNVFFTYGHINVKSTFKFAYTTTAPAAGSDEWKDYSDFFTNVTYAADKKTVEWKKVWVRVTAGDNYVATNIYAHVKINPKNLGGGGGGDDAIVADDQSIAYGKDLPKLTWRGGNGLVDGDVVSEVKLSLTNGVVASTLPKGVYLDMISTNATVAQAIVITNSAGTDVTGNYTGFFTPGTLTVVAGGMEIGPDGPVEHPPAGQPPIPPADPEDEKSWTNGALSVTKTYDGKATNIVVTVVKPMSGSTVTYSYDKTDWKPYGDFDGYTTVTNKATVWFRIEAPNYQTITNRAFVTINPAPILPPTDNPPLSPGEPKPGPGPAPITEPDGPWAAAYNVEKDYDGLGTNVIFTYGHIDVKPTFKFAYTKTAPAADSNEWKDYSDIFTNVTYAADKKTVKWEKVWVRVTAGDNYIARSLYANVKINPKNLGGGGGGDDAIVADDQSIAYGKDLPDLTWRGGNGLVDGDGVSEVKLALTNGVVASTLPKGVYPGLISTNAAVAQAIVITNSVGADVTGNYTGFFTPGTLTVTAGGMEIGPNGPVEHPPAGQPPIPPADPEDETTWTNGALSVTKTYDGKATNIVVTVVKPTSGSTITYSYDKTDWKPYGEFDGYTTVTNKATVWFRIEAPNYQTITNCAFVTINPKKLDDDPENPDNAIVADDKSIAYGDACPTLTWRGGKGLVAGDYIDTVSLALKDGADASKLRAGVYPGLITTNAAIVIWNSKGVDVTDCYEGFFTPGKFTVSSAPIRHEIEVPNVPYDGKGTNITVRLISESVPPFVLKYRGPDTPEGVWLDEPPVYTNASPYDITYVIEDGDNYTPVTNTVTMIISPRKITLKSPNKEKNYDTKPLRLLADEIAAGGMGFADGERFGFSDLAEITLPGTVKATFGYGDGTAALDNYEVMEVEYGQLRVNPSGDQVLVRSASGRWTYDGEAHSTNAWEIVGEENLYEGDWLQIALKGNAVTTPDQGDVTNEFATVEVYRGPKDDLVQSKKVTSEYVDRLLRDEGLLTVVNAKFTNPAVTPYSGLYDGLDHGISVEKPHVPGGLASVDYPDGNTFRDVTNAVVRFVISARYYDDYVGESTVEILPREVVFITSDDMKEYDGDPLETPTNIKVDGDGFVGDENYAVRKRDQQIEVGRSDAGFEYDLTGGAKSGNYRIRMVKGSLTVYDDEKLTVIATNGVHVFDGNEYSNHDVTIKNLPAECTVIPVFAASSVITYPGEVANRIASIRILKGGDDVTTDYETVLIDGKLKVVAAKLEGGEVVSTNVVYDGTGHSIVVTPPAYKGSGPVTIEYSTTGWDGPYQSDNPQFKLADPDGTPNDVYVRISVPGYEDYYTNGYVTVTRRPVTIASGSAEKTYDGEPLSNDVVRVVGEVGLADGDVLVAVTTASQTSAGKTDNAFDYRIMDAETKSLEQTKNYHVTIDNGVLTVKSAPISPWNPEGPGDEPAGPWVWLADATMVYTGMAGTNVTVTSGHFASGLPKLEYRPEGTLKFLPFAQAFTNVMYDAEGNYRSTNVTVRFTGDANYQPTNLTAKVTILPGSIEVGPDGPVTHPPAGQPPMPPADPADETTWTNGARSVTKEYDGKATNILVTVVTPPTSARVRYRRDEGGEWKSAEDFEGYTDVTNRASVWYLIEIPNYQPVTNRAFVTILARIIDDERPPEISPEDWGDRSSVRADPVVVTEGDNLPTPTWQGGKGLLPGDRIEFVPTYVGYSDTPGVYRGAVTTNAPDHLIVILNAGGEDVTKNYAIKFYPADLTVEECTAFFRASLKWMYYNGEFLAQIKVENANTTGRIAYDAGSMRFCFADRQYAWLVNAKSGTNGHEPLDSTVTYASAVGDRRVSTTYRSFALKDPADGWTAHRAGNAYVYGPKDGTDYSSSKGGVQLVLLMQETPLMGVTFRNQEPLTRLSEYVGYLVWTCRGKTCSLPLVSQGELNRDMTMRSTSDGKLEKAARDVTPTEPSAPVALEALNRALILGVPYNADHETVCEVTDFAVSGGTIYGQVHTLNGAAIGVPSAKAVVKLQGAVSLGEGETFENLGTVYPNASTGDFSFSADPSFRFFRIRLDVEQIFK